VERVGLTSVLNAAAAATTVVEVVNEPNNPNPQRHGQPTSTPTEGVGVGLSVLRKGGPSSHSRTQHHDYVFTTETGRLMDQRNASRGYARALKRAGLETVPARFHIIRHSVTSKMLVDGAVSMRTASEVLGRATT